MAKHEMQETRAMVLFSFRIAVDLLYLEVESNVHISP